MVVAEVVIAIASVGSTGGNDGGVSGDGGSWCKQVQLKFCFL